MDTGLINVWYPLELAFEGHHVIYLTLLFGMELVTAPYTITELAAKYWRHLDEINVQQINLVGHSMGGYVCMEMLAQQPSRVSSLALVHSHVYADTPEKKLARSSIAKHKSNGREEFINKFIPSLFANAINRLN
jgi:pimeloyl-ACP methyl ester carboxylesterase